jgi:twitching motility two-component system response regulator PilH
MARILIVEDSPTQLETIKRVVEGMGHLALCAENGDEAFDMAHSLKPDMILMDIILPGSNGFQTTRKLSRDKATSNIPVVILSAKDGESDKSWGLRQGAKAYLTKPVSDQQLRQVIKEQLGIS